MKTKSLWPHLIFLPEPPSLALGFKRKGPSVQGASGGAVITGDNPSLDFLVIHAY